MDWLDRGGGMQFDKDTEWLGARILMCARVNKNNSARSPDPEWVTMRGLKMSKKLFIAATAVSALAGGMVTAGAATLDDVKTKGHV